MGRVPRTVVVLAALGCLCLARGVVADEGRPSADRGADEKFVHKACMAGMAEVKLGQLAVDQASSPEVRKFGQRMVDDHSRANRELMDICERKGLTPDKNMGRHHQELMERLSKLSGADFDRQYVSHLVKDHDEAIELFEREAKDGQDPDLRAYAEKALPTLREHQQMARDLYRGVDRGR